MKQRIRLKVQLMSGYGTDYSKAKIIRILDFLGNDCLEYMAIHILKSFDFDYDHAFSIFDDINNPKESYSVFADMDDNDDFGHDDKSVVDTLIEQVFTTKGKTMIMHFDYGDDWIFNIKTVDFIPVLPKDRKKKPLLIESIGIAPEQYPSDEDE